MTDTTLDPYATLGVPRGADARRLRDAYRRLIRQHHPDRSNDPRATERMQRINRAWDLVSDPARRAEYDAESRTAGRGGAGHWAGTRGRAAHWAPPPTAWATQTARAGTYPPPPVTFDDDERPSWRAIAAVLLFIIVAGPLLFAFLPIPFIGLIVAVVVGSLARSAT